MEETQKLQPEADHTGGRAHGRRVGARAAAPQYFWNGREARQPRAASKPDARGLRASRPCSELIVTANSGFFSNLDRVWNWVWEVGLLTRTSPSPPQDQCNASDSDNICGAHSRDPSCGVGRLAEMARREHVVGTLTPLSRLGIWRLASARQVQSTRVPAAVC